MSIVEPEGVAPDRTNWRDAPHNRTAFRTIDRILSTDRVAAGGPASPLAAGPRELDPPTLPDAGLTLDAALEITAGDALVVLHEGRVVLERYAPGMDRDTTHILMSATKAVTGLLAELLARDGRVALDAPVESLVPEVAAGGYAGATLRQLLDMRAGVRLDVDGEARYQAAASGTGDPGGGPAPTLRGLAAAAPRGAPHGGPFAYVSLNTDLLGWALERATGRTYAEVLSERLWRPLGCERNAQVMVDREGAAWSSGGICATARDLARLGAALADPARPAAPPPELADTLMHGGDAEAWRMGEWGQAFSFLGADLAYRSGWYAVRDAPAHLFAMGVHGQNLFVDREAGIVMAKLSSQAERIDPRAIWITHALFTAVRRALAG